MLRDGKFPAGVYAFKKPNTWYPVIYFHKPRAKVNKKVYRAVLKHLNIKAL